MEKRTIRRLRGAAELVTDAVEAAATEAQLVHEALARRPYAVLARVPLLAGPVKAIESVQVAVTAAAYAAVRAVNGIAGAVVTAALDRLEPDARSLRVPPRPPTAPRARRPSPSR